MITNYLSTGGFEIKISRLPNVEFFSQKMQLPSVTTSSVEVQTPLRSFYNEPDHIEFGNFDLSFIIDENMKNYIEIFDWLVGLTSPDNLKQHANLKNSKEGLKSDVSVMLLNSHKNPNMKFTFINAFPLSLTPVSLDIAQTDVQYAEATVTMRYDSFTIEKM